MIKKHSTAVYITTSFHTKYFTNCTIYLFILLALISFFFISFKDFFKDNYLRIRWIDFHNLFTERKRFGCR